VLTDETRIPYAVAQGVRIDKQRPTTHFNILVTVAIGLTHRNEALCAVVRDEMECVRTEVQG